MPVINGVKMACAPCIRGHRSTKCAHHDRVMIAVKKPGRPLSTCPHAPGIQCSCSGVQAAIPIQHHGRCPPQPEQTPCHQVAVKAEEDATDKALQSPTKTTQRVKKSSRDGPLRKQSIDPTALERMNPNSLNILPSPSMSSFSPIDQTANIGSAFSTNGASLPSEAHTSDDQKTQTALHETSSIAQKENGASPPAIGSCCASRAATQLTSQNGGNGVTSSSHSHTRSSSTDSKQRNGIAQQAALNAGGSCCSSKARGSAQMAQVSSVLPQQANMVTYPPQYQQMVDMNSAMYNQTAMNGMPFWPGPIPQQTNGYVFMNGVVPQYPPTFQVFAQPSAANMYPMMVGPTGRPIQCQCGDVCECLGCIDHPFNTVTRDYVASAINAQGWTKNGEDDADGSTEDVHSSEASSSIPSPVGEALLEQMMPSQSMQQAVSSDYLVFNYSYGCLGEPEHCPCGDDCACVGCTIHGGNSSNASSANGLGLGGS